MTIALVQQTSTFLDPLNTTTVITLPSAITAGSMLVLTGVGAGGGIEVTSVSGGGIITWVKEIRQSASNIGYAFVWYGLSSLGGSLSISVSRNGYNNNSTSTVVNIAEYSGVQLIETVVDGTPSSNSSGHTPADSGNTTPSSGTEVLLIGCAGQQPAGNPFAGITSGFTALSTPDGQFFGPGYQVVSSATGSYNFGWATGGFSSGAGYMNWGSIIVAFKSASGGGGTQYTTTLSGSITPAGVLFKQTQRSLSGVITPVGSIIHLCQRTLSAIITPSGLLTKQTRRSLAGVITPSGVLTTSKVALLALAGSITPAGLLVKQTIKNLIATITPSGTITKLCRKTLNGVILLVGDLTLPRSNQIILNAVIAPIGVLTKQTRRILNGSITPSGAATYIKNFVPAITTDLRDWWMRRRKR